MRKSALLACLALLASCSGELSDPGSSASSMARRFPATLTATPNPANASGAAFTLSGSGFLPNVEVKVAAQAPLCCSTLTGTAAADGTVSITGFTGQAGTYRFDARQWNGKRDILMARASLVVVDPSAVCGDGVCNGTETCSSCAGDCGACTIDCRNPATWPAGWIVFEDEVLRLVNQSRASGATCGATYYPPVPALLGNADLREAARCHSLDMAVNNYFSHTSLDGRSPWQRIDQAGYTGFGNAENIAAGYSTAAAVMAGWMASSGHCANIMRSGSNEIGVGYAYQAGSNFGHYWTQDFGWR